MSACDCEAPSVYDLATPIARAPHRCGECRQTIPAGKRYQRLRGCWNGEWATWITCLRCVEARKWLERQETWCECIPLGELVPGVAEWVQASTRARKMPEDPALAGWILGLVMGDRIREDDAREARLAAWREKRAAQEGAT